MAVTELGAPGDARMDEHAVREILQARIVAGIFSERVRGEILLKGGLAMRAAYRSRRGTKDIDLHTGPEVPTARSQSLVRQAIKAALADGLLQRPEVSEPKMTETVQRWKVRGWQGETRVTMTVELSRRGSVPAQDRMLAAYAPEPGGAGPVTMIETLAPHAMAAAKVLALGDPRREAPRDLYDLDLLIRSEIEPPAEVLARVGIDRLREIRSILSDKIEKLDWRAARDELVDYLPRAEAVRLDEAAWGEVQARTYLAVDDWLDRAIRLRESQEMGAAPQDGPDEEAGMAMGMRA